MDKLGLKCLPKKHQYKFFVGRICLINVIIYSTLCFEWMVLTETHHCGGGCKVMACIRKKEKTQDTENDTKSPNFGMTSR